MISVENLSKTYRVARKGGGLYASVRSLFSRRYEEVEAVRSISFSIGAGERVGFLGPNGAGKTTTLKMLSGLLTPTEGRVSVLGFDPRRRPRSLLLKIAMVMGQKQQLLWDLPPIDTLELNRAVYGIPEEQFSRTLGELTEMLELGALLDKPTRQLSLGERMKCELAAALVHRPSVLFLDEPTIGLDVTMQATMRRFIRDYNESTGATVLLTTHYMDDVAALCPRVIIIDQGRLRHDGDLSRLIAETHPDKLIRVRLSRPFLDADRSVLENGSGLRVADIQADTFTLLCPPHTVADSVKRLLGSLPVIDLRVEDPPLDIIMQQVFGRAKGSRATDPGGAR